MAELLRVFVRTYITEKQQVKSASSLRLRVQISAIKQLFNPAVNPSLQNMTPMWHCLRGVGNKKQNSTCEPEENKHLLKFVSLLFGFVQDLITNSDSNHLHIVSIALEGEGG